MCAMDTQPTFVGSSRYFLTPKLVKSYDFGFGFCIPASTNTWDAVYQVPPLDEELSEYSTVRFCCIAKLIVMLGKHCPLQ